MADAIRRVEAQGRFGALEDDALRDPPPDGSHRPRLLRAMRERIEEIIQREGSFTVSKSVGYFVATVDRSLPDQHTHC